MLSVPPQFSSEPTNLLEKFKCRMFFYDIKIVNPKLAPNWFTNKKVIMIISYLGYEEQALSSGTEIRFRL